LTSVRKKKVIRGRTREFALGDWDVVGGGGQRNPEEESLLEAGGSGQTSRMGGSRGGFAQVQLKIVPVIEFLVSATNGGGETKTKRDISPEGGEIKKKGQPRWSERERILRRGVRP